MDAKVRITSFEVRDVRFPTSLDKTGSDAMNVGCDYSAAYCILHTTSEHIGHGMTFTIGRGNELVCKAIPLFASRILFKPLSSLVSNFGQTWRHLVSDSQIRWIGPEKGVTQLALAAVVNAIWDLWAKIEGKPVWRLVADMTPEQLVNCIDFRYIEDAITPEEAVEMLKATAAEGKFERMYHAKLNQAVPAYSTSAGWLGYSDERMQDLIRQGIRQGFKSFKFKVGTSIEQDRHRLTLVRDVLGFDSEYVVMVDANQVWSVPEAIAWMKQLADFKPWFIEEPTSPDDILGHKTIRDALKPLNIGVATGEMCQNRIIFKQLLQAGAIDVCQVDACRLGGLNEVLAVLLMAKKFNIPVVPHSGGVGLPEYTAHISTIDYISISGRKSILEYVDHLHEHFEYPSAVVEGHIRTPTEAGYSVQLKRESMNRFTFPGDDQSWWKSPEAKAVINAERK